MGKSKMTKEQLRKALGERKVPMGHGLSGGWWVSGSGWTDSRRPKSIMEEVYGISKPLGKNEFFDNKGNVRHRKLKFFGGRN